MDEPTPSVLPSHSKTDTDISQPASAQKGMARSSSIKSIERCSFSLTQTGSTLAHSHLPLNPNPPQKTKIKMIKTTAARFLRVCECSASRRTSS